MQARTAAITGIGVLAPGGIGTKAFWDLLTAGRTATWPISLFDATGFRSRIAAERDFVPEHAGISAAESARMARVAQFAVASTREAMTDSGLDFGTRAPERVVVVMGSAVGCTRRLEEQYARVSRGGRE